MRVARQSVWLVGSYLVAAGLIWAVSATPQQVAQEPRLSTQEISLKLDSAQSKVQYTVDTTLHTVHGTFAVKDGSAMHFDPSTGKAGGELVVVATSGESGNHSRDERMHKEILETQKYPLIVFQPRLIEGTVAPKGISDVRLHGVMQIHGSEHEITAEVHAEITGVHWKGTAKFDVPYVQWGVKDPSNWIFKVKPTVQVEVDAAGSVAR